MATYSAQKLIECACQYLGTKESPKNSNNVIFNTKYYGRVVSGSNYSWCAVYVWYAFNKLKYDNIIYKSAGADKIQDYTVSKKGGTWIMKKNSSKKTRKAALAKAKYGDIIDFDFGRYDSYRSHTGIILEVTDTGYITLEGNTSDTSNGSQSNGGMCCRKFRNYYEACTIVRPAFSVYAKGKHYTGDLFYTTIKYGNKNSNVKKWQKFLKWYKYSLETDGDFGEITKKFTKEFQRKMKLEVDGIVGPKTIAAAASVLKV